MQAAGYCRIDTRHVSESLPEHAMPWPCRHADCNAWSCVDRGLRFDLISLGRCCVVAEGAKLRPAAAEEGPRARGDSGHRDFELGGRRAPAATVGFWGLLRRGRERCQGPIAIPGSRIARASHFAAQVCTAGCAVGDHVTLQPLLLGMEIISISDKQRRLQVHVVGTHRSDFARWLGLEGCFAGAVQTATDSGACWIPLHGARTADPRHSPDKVKAPISLRLRRPRPSRRRLCPAPHTFPAVTRRSHVKSRQIFCLACLASQDRLQLGGLLHFWAAGRGYCMCARGSLRCLSPSLRPKAYGGNKKVSV